MNKKSLAIGLTVATSLLVSASAFAQNSLLFSTNHNDLGAAGSSISTWGGLTANSTNYKVTEVGGTKWADNTVAGGGNVIKTADYTAPIALNGATIVTHIKAQTTGVEGWDPRSIVSVMYNQFALGLERDGSLFVTRFGNMMWTRIGATPFRLANNQEATVSVVAQNDGAFELWVNGVSVMTGGATGAAGSFGPFDPNKLSDSWGPNWAELKTLYADSYAAKPATMDDWTWYWNSLTAAQRDAVPQINTPWNPAYDNAVEIGGRWIDGWLGSNAMIGDTYLYTNALSAADRVALEGQIAANYSAAVPEPGSIVAMLSGLVGLAGYGIRRRK